ncbi:30S ribosomal protein S11 [Candidatus Pacearchaeota archaeon ex4484_26]|nr:MAG: 30S ribosomal protein S11 [Candidatus Pacearchaeota archaeon ex4484_26]
MKTKTENKTEKTNRSKTKLEKTGFKESKNQQNKNPEKEHVAIAKIYSTYNNTIIHIVDVAGNTIAKASGGQVTKYDRLKASPTVAMFAAKKAAYEAKEKGINALHIRIRGKGGHEGPHNPGPGSQAVLKSFSRAGIRIKSIVDVTPIAHGGCKSPHGRRGRRV